MDRGLGGETPGGLSISPPKRRRFSRHRVEEQARRLAPDTLEPRGVIIPDEPGER